LGVVLAFLFGIVWGSFLNVCIYRLPKGISIIKPFSFCPFCKSPIKPYDNIPLLSFLILKGRCRNCKGKIPLRYPLVELMGGLLGVFCLLKFPSLLKALPYFLFLSGLLVSSFIDFEHQIIPDEISLGGIMGGVLFSLLGLTIPLKSSLLGALFGGGILFLLGFLYERFTKREGMGGGDIKLLGMIGSFLGVKGAMFSLFTGSLLGLLFSLPFVLKSKAPLKSPIPFGPFLSSGAFLYLAFSERLKVIWG